MKFDCIGSRSLPLQRERDREREGEQYPIEYFWTYTSRICNNKNQSHTTDALDCNKLRIKSTYGLVSFFQD